MKTEVIVQYRGAGWYKFSPNGHRDYTRRGEVTVRGRKALQESLMRHNCVACEMRGI